MYMEMERQDWDYQPLDTKITDGTAVHITTWLLKAFADDHGSLSPEQVTAVTIYCREQALKSLERLKEKEVKQ